MKKLFLFFIAIILCVTICNAEELSAVRNDDVTIVYDNGLYEAAASAARIYPGIKEGLERIIGWKIDFKPNIYLVKSHKRFMSMSGHPLVVAYAVPEKMLIVIDYSKMMFDPFSVSSIMKHELCHLLLHKNILNKNLPKWFDEGVSQWVSGGLADIVIGDHARLDRAIVNGRHMPFKYLSQYFPGDNDGLMLAYAQSKSFVEYMAMEFSPEGMGLLLEGLKNGKKMETAVYETFRISFDELEKNWYSSVKKRTTWLTMLISHLYEVVFFLGAVSLIIAYVKTVIRKRAQKDDEDDDIRKYPQ